MSGQASSSTRARDIDRAQTCGVLDAGYSEGQLDTTEYDARTAAAMKAKTLGELDALVSDLQIPAHLVETALRTATAPRRLRRGPVIAAAIAAVAVVIGTVFFVARDDETAQTPAAPEVVAAAEEPAPLPAPIPGEPDAIVIEPIDTTTVEGIRAFIDRYRAKFKDTLVDRAIFYPERASVDRAVDGAPHLYQRYDFMNGFKPSMTPNGRGPDTQAIDLADIDLDRLAANLATAPDRVRLSTGRIGDIDVRTTGGEVEVAISVESPDKRSGSVYTTLGGDEIDVRTADR
ncbi:DUF1707 domain-containing protein [Rhodococcus sp. AG1013]|uniref:DUF1707 SHOCT-like domain-containing protein n=1 Tax=Rhodococcus sp. AG1013 TaxID=2183996 RepID=UPI00215DA867|nr:DUF1707 domain-containing protein [Rhodococcus sp. AG1013]